MQVGFPGTDVVTEQFPPFLQWPGRQGSLKWQYSPRKPGTHLDTQVRALHIITNTDGEVERPVKQKVIRVRAHFKERQIYETKSEFLSSTHNVGPHQTAVAAESSVSM